MNKPLEILLLIVTMAAVTFAIRAIPFVLIKRKINSRFIRSLLYYIPYAVLSAMTFPFILYSTGGNFYAALAGTVVAIAAAFFKASLLIVALLACLTSLAFVIIL